MDKPETTSFVRKRLPHWEVAGGRFFVTIRLKGAIPDAGMKRLAKLRASLEEFTDESEIVAARYKIFVEMEKWLDAASHVRHLERADVAQIVIDSLRDRESRGIWVIYAYTIMPNHIHFFIGLNDRSPQSNGKCCPKQSGKQRRDFLIHQIETFKRWTATHAAKVLRIDGPNFWQREWFDHWSRSPEQDERILRYIRNNAVKAGLAPNAEAWPYWWQRPKANE